MKKNSVKINAGLARRHSNKSRRDAVRRKVFQVAEEDTSSSLSIPDQEELVLENRLKARKLGRSILRKWHARMDLEEIDSVVDLSLCEAVRRFNPDKGASFMTFLYYHLRGNLIRFITSAATANTVPAFEDEIERASGDFTSALDLAETLTGRETYVPEEMLLKKELVELSVEACDRLDPLEREVIQRIYIKGQQLIDIANKLGYSRCHISRVKRRALESLHDDLTLLLSDNRELEEDIVAEREATIDKRAERRKVHRRRPRSTRKSRQGSSELVALAV